MPQHDDILFLMERFFRHCLIDRTATFGRSDVSIRVLHPMPTLDKDKQVDDDDDIGLICDERARSILRHAVSENRNVHVMWSGGIDSTTALVALLRVGTEEELRRVKVLYTVESCLEYPLMFAVLCKLAGAVLEKTDITYKNGKSNRSPKEEGKQPVFVMRNWRGAHSNGRGNGATTDEIMIAAEIAKQIMMERRLLEKQLQRDSNLDEGKAKNIQNMTCVPALKRTIPIELVQINSLSEIYSSTENVGKRSKGHVTSETEGHDTSRSDSHPLNGECKAVLNRRIASGPQKPLLVTGEHGDQIFGSMYMRYFYDADECKSDPKLSPRPLPCSTWSSPSSTHSWPWPILLNARSNRSNRRNGFRRGGGRGMLPTAAQRILRGTQLEPWRAIMPDFFVAASAIPAAAKGKWVEWMEQQTSRAPIPIVSVFDYLWWISFSMKWQHVALRILSVDGERDRAVLRERYERTVHFFNSEEFQQWSLRNQHRNRKMGDINKWSTYKVCFILSVFPTKSVILAR